MNRREELASRRSELVQRCTIQRDNLTTAADGAARSLWAVDAAVVLTRRAARQPLVVTGAVMAIFIVFRPRRVWAFALWSISTIATVRRVADSRTHG